MKRKGNNVINSAKNVRKKALNSINRKIITPVRNVANAIVTPINNINKMTNRVLKNTVFKPYIKTRNVTKELFSKIIENEKKGLERVLRPFRKLFSNITAGGVAIFLLIIIILNVEVDFVVIMIAKGLTPMTWVQQSFNIGGKEETLGQYSYDLLYEENEEWFKELDELKSETNVDKVIKQTGSKKKNYYTYTDPITRKKEKITTLGDSKNTNPSVKRYYNGSEFVYKYVFLK